MNHFREEQEPSEQVANGNVARWDMEAGPLDMKRGRGPLAVEISEGGVATLIFYTTGETGLGPRISARVHVHDPDVMRTMSNLLADAATDLEDVKLEHGETGDHD